MSTTQPPCLINQSACGRQTGNPVCPKCGIDDRVVYPGQGDLEVALASAVSRYLANEQMPSVERAKELANAGKVQEGREMLIRLAQQEDAAAMYELSNLYRSGGWGLLKDEHEHKKWLHRASQKGNPAAMREFAWHLCSKGDHDAAFQLLNKAKLAGYAPAFIELAEFHMGVWLYKRRSDTEFAGNHQAAALCLRELASIASNDWFWMHSQAEAIKLAVFGPKQIRELFGHEEIQQWLTNLEGNAPELAFPATLPLRIGVTLLNSWGRTMPGDLQDQEEKLIAEFGQEAAGNSLKSLADELRYGAYEEPLLRNLLLERASALGSKEAIIDGANSLLNGSGVEKDVRAAINILTEVAAEGNAKAAFILGQIYSDDAQECKDLTLAKKWYALAEADSDYWTSIGTAYLFGDGALYDPRKGLKLAEQAAASGGWANSQVGFMLGYAYSLGIGVSASAEVGDKYFKSYLESNLTGKTRAELTYRIAEGFAVGKIEGRETKNKELFLKWVVLAAEEGNLEAAIGLAYSHQPQSVLHFLNHYIDNKIWSEADLEKSSEKALHYWLIAAQQGDIQAAAACAYFLSIDESQTKNLIEARRWVERVRNSLSAVERPWKMANACVQMAALAHHGALTLHESLNVEFWIRAAVAASESRSPADVIRLCSLGSQLEIPIATKIEILELAATSGDERANFELGVTLLQQPGAENKSLAEQWFQRYQEAAELTTDPQWKYRIAENVVKAIGGLPNWSDYLDSSLLCWLEHAQKLGSARAPFTLSLLKQAGKISAHQGDLKTWIKIAYKNAQAIVSQYSDETDEVQDLDRLDSDCNLIINLGFPAYDSKEKDELEYALAEAGSAKCQIELSKRFARDWGGHTADLPEAFFWANEAAKQADPDGLYMRAIHFLNGSGCEKNPKRFLSDCTESANKGCIKAMLTLARISMRNESSLPTNLTVADQWLERAKAAGADPDQLTNQFWDLQKEPGTAALYFKWCNKLFDAKDENTIYNLARCYATAIGVAEDQGKSDKLLEEWLALKWSEAGKITGITQEDGLPWGEGSWPHWWFTIGAGSFPVDERRAFDWCRRLHYLADNAHLMERLGDAYCTGFGVERNLAAANDWWLRASAKSPRSLGVLKAAAYSFRKKGSDAIAAVEAALQAPCIAKNGPNWRALLTMMLVMARKSELSFREATELRLKCDQLALAHEVFADFCLDKPHLKATLKLAQKHYSLSSHYLLGRKKYGEFIGSAEVERINGALARCSQLEPLPLWKALFALFK